MKSEFPDEEMSDKAFRDKDKDFVIITWILEVGYTHLHKIRYTDRN